jgi:hypothetical protein
MSDGGISDNSMSGGGMSDDSTSDSAMNHNSTSDSCVSDDVASLTSPLQPHLFSLASSASPLQPHLFSGNGISNGSTSGDGMSHNTTFSIPPLQRQRHQQRQHPTAPATAA